MHLNFEGFVTHTQGTIIGASIPSVPVGSEAIIQLGDNRSLSSEVVGFNSSGTLLAPFGGIEGVFSGARVTSQGLPPSIVLSDELKGSIIDALGNSMLGEKIFGERKSLARIPPQPLTRPPITSHLETGIRVIDTFLPIGKGQRLCLIAPAGTGKSTLISQIARSASVDVIVIALIGERGREVREFLDITLTESIRKKCIVVVSTSDEPPIRRAKAQETATSIAEYFRDQGKDVLLLVDSLTRTARALRDVGLSLGEMPVRHGYTPSVFAKLPPLLERAGTSENGSITALYTLLGNEDGLTDDPLAEEIKSLLDGHILLSRSVAQEGIYPAINILRSLSRLEQRLSSEETKTYASIVRRYLQRIEKDKDLILLGGTPDQELRKALLHEPAIRKFRSQKIDETASMSDSHQLLKYVLSNES